MVEEADSVTSGSLGSNQLLYLPTGGRDFEEKAIGSTRPHCLTAVQGGGRVHGGGIWKEKGGRWMRNGGWLEE